MDYVPLTCTVGDGCPTVKNILTYSSSHNQQESANMELVLHPKNKTSEENFAHASIT